MKPGNRFRKSAIGIFAVCATMWSFMLVADDEVTITAVTATYDHDIATTIFEGDVRLTSEDVNLDAERVEIVTLEDGSNKVTASGDPIKFSVQESGEESASGLANTAIVYYSSDQIHLSGDVTFEQGDIVVETQTASYNWSTRELQTSESEDENVAPSDNRTTVTIQLQN